jgi:hypothetical protein
MQKPLMGAEMPHHCGCTSIDPPACPMDIEAVMFMAVHRLIHVRRFAKVEFCEVLFIIPFPHERRLAIARG